MDADAYQKLAHTTSVYPKDVALQYLAIALCGEAGEFANKVKKILRGDVSEFEMMVGLLHELGDVQWYIAELCTYIGVDLGAVMARNLKMLAERQERDLIKGSGDNR